METNRWKVMLALSSDHAGINVQLGKFQRALSRILARVDDPRQVRDLFRFVEQKSAEWCIQNSVDERGWMERTRKRAG
jgi:hypothetical protein